MYVYLLAVYSCTRSQHAGMGEHTLFQVIQHAATFFFPRRVLYSAVRESHAPRFVDLRAQKHPVQRTCLPWVEVRGWHVRIPVVARRFAIYMEYIYIWFEIGKNDTYIVREDVLPRTGESARSTYRYHSRFRKQKAHCTV